MTELSAPSQPVVAVLVELRVSRGQEARFTREMRAVFDRIRQEPACIAINGHQDDEDPGRFLLVELWRSAAEFQEFVAGRDYMREYFARVEPLWEGDKVMSIWPQVA